MEKYRYTKKIAGITAVLLVMISCDPGMKDKDDIGLPPSADQLDFTVAPGKDEFHVVITNNSSVTGIAHWDFGNGIQGTGETFEVKYPLEGTYTIKMTYVTRGGTASVTKDYVQASTDFSIFTDPVYVNLSGGADDADGKTWVLDASTKGHLAVGDANGAGNGMEWWSANPMEKEGTGAYDDELTFILNEFVVNYDNKGVSYVKGYMKDDAALASLYLNPRVNKDDWDVDYTTPVSGTWTILQRDGNDYLVINSDKRIFPGLDVGAKNNEYRIVSVTENLLELTCHSAYEDWTMWHFYLIPKGYVRPTITYTVNATEGSDNDVAFSVTGYTIPEGQSVTNITWNFGDGSDEVAAGKDEVVHHTFMRRGVYNVTAKLNTSLGELTSTEAVTLANNHSTYVPFLLDMMVVYNDFSEVQSFPVGGQDCSVTIVDNPSQIYPNKSAKVALYRKENNQWANAFMELNPGYRFDLRQQHIFRVLVYGKTGDRVLLKLENTDLGGDAWTTGTNDLVYTIVNTDKWELAEFDFSGVGSNGAGSIVATDIVTDASFNHDYYNVIRIMCNPGDGEGVHEFYFDDLSGPHVEGIAK